MTSVKRVQKELKEMTENPPPGATAAPVGPNVYHWKASIRGPSGTPYEGGVFTMDITFPADYPFSPPKVVFETKVYHPNVERNTGAICLDILKDQWSPALSIAKVLLSIQAFLSEPNEDFHLEPDIGRQFVSDRAQFNATAAQWTRDYARPK